MKVLWTLLKVALALVLVIPVCIIVLATVLGLFGALLGLAVLALRVAVVGLVAWGAWRLFSRLMRGPAPKARPAEIPRPAAPVDPYYQSALRDLDRELGEPVR